MPGTFHPEMTDSLELWPRSRVADRILQGDTLVIYESCLLRIPQAWLAAHPGGALAILHFVGRDATDEINAFHAEETLRKRVKPFIVGRVEAAMQGWEPLVPPVATGWIRKRQAGKESWVHSAEEKRAAVSNPDSIVFDEHNYSPSQILLVEKTHDTRSTGPTLATITPSLTPLSLTLQTRHSVAYRELHKRVTAAGLYETPYFTGYGPEVLRYAALATASSIAYSYSWFVPSAFFLGLLWHQLTFIAHDLGHMGVTHDWVWDRVLSILIANFVGGLSIGWWVDVRSSSSVRQCLPFADALRLW